MISRTENSQKKIETVNTHSNLSISESVRPTRKRGGIIFIWPQRRKFHKYRELIFSTWFLTQLFYWMHLLQLLPTDHGYEVVIVKGGQRVCGAGAALGNAPLVQSKSYFEAKIQQGGSWSIGLATRQTDLSLTQGGMDEHSWALCSDHIIRHNKKELFKINTGNATKELNLQEGDLIGVSYDHIQLKFYVNGKELDQSITNVKGTVYPAIYVDDGAIVDIILDNFIHAPPSGFDKIMLEQSLL